MAKPLSRSRALAAKQDAIDRGADCVHCPLFTCRDGPVQTEHSKQPIVYLLGELPGKDEVIEGRPHVGQQGRIIAKAMALAGIDRRELTLGNVIECRPTIKGGLKDYLRVQLRKNKPAIEARKREVAAWKAADPKTRGPRPSINKILTPIEACGPRAASEVLASTAKVVLAIGKIAHDLVADAYGIKVGKRKKNEPPDASDTKRIGVLAKQAGHPYFLPDGKIYLCVWHPIWAARDKPAYVSTIAQYLVRAFRIAKRGWSWEEPRFRINPSSATVIQFCEDVLRRKPIVAVDIETDSLHFDAEIRSIQLGFDRPARIGSGLRGSGIVREILVFPIRYFNGRAYWRGKCSAATFARMRGLIHRVLDECRLGFHNGTFDTRHLRARGWMSAVATDTKPWADSLAIDKNSRYNDLRHDLASVSARVAACPNWKPDVDHKSSDAASYDEWQRYGARDIDATLMCLTAQREWIRRDGTAKQNRIDARLLPILRNMTELGVPISRPMLEANSAKLRIECARRLNTLRELSGRPTLNPNSAPQVRDLIFRRWGNEPTIPTGGGHEMLEDDEASTGIPALMMVQDHGCDRRTHQFIDQLIVYKSIEKLRSSFVDNLLDPDPESDEPLPIMPSPWPGIFFLHPNWKLGPPTGRFATRPNVQNWPTVSWLNMREMIVAPPGHLFVAADSEQIEGRIFAADTQDEGMRRVFEQGLDLHCMNFAMLKERRPADREATYQQLVAWKSSADHVEQMRAKMLRLVAKIFCFGEQYGMDENTAYRHMRTARDKATGERLFPKIKRSETDLYHQLYHEGHPNAQPWQRRCVEHVLRHGFIDEPVDGRRRWSLDGLEKVNMPPNHRIQGGAAAFMNRSIIAIDDHLGHRKLSPHSGIFFQGHDEIVACVPERDAEETARVFERAFEHETDGIRIFGKPEIVRYMTGPNLRGAKK